MDRNYQIVRSIMLATNQIDGVYYFLAKKLGVNENALAFLYALDDGQPPFSKRNQRCMAYPPDYHSLYRQDDAKRRIYSVLHRAA